MFNENSAGKTGAARESSRMNSWISSFPPGASAHAALLTMAAADSRVFTVQHLGNPDDIEAVADQVAGDVAGREGDAFAEFEGIHRSFRYAPGGGQIKDNRRQFRVVEAEVDGVGARSPPQVQESATAAQIDALGDARRGPGRPC